VADSFASGIGIPIGVYATDVFGEAEESPDGFITVDFLNGKVRSRVWFGTARKRRSIFIAMSLRVSVESTRSFCFSFPNGDRLLFCWPQRQTSSRKN